MPFFKNDKLQRLTSHLISRTPFYDDVQFTKRDWRSRNLIKTSGGIKWLSIPVLSKGRYLQKINETEIDG